MSPATARVDVCVIGLGPAGARAAAAAHLSGDAASLRRAWIAYPEYWIPTGAAT